MADYLDYDFRLNEYGGMQTYTGKNAIVMAIRNILLTKPGNFPMTPGMGLDISKYMQEPADDITLSRIKSELSSQIAKYVPSVDSVTVSVTLVDKEFTDSNGDSETEPVIGISVSALGDEAVNANFLVLHDGEDVNVFTDVL